MQVSLNRIFYNKAVDERLLKKFTLNEGENQKVSNFESDFALIKSPTQELKIDNNNDQMRKKLIIYTVTKKKFSFYKEKNSELQKDEFEVGSLNNVNNYFNPFIIENDSNNKEMISGRFGKNEKKEKIPILCIDVKEINKTKKNENLKNSKKSYEQKAKKSRQENSQVKINSSSIHLIENKSFLNSKFPNFN